MQEDYGPNFITITDEDGSEIELEFVDALEFEGETYMAFFPVLEEEDQDTQGEEYGLIILRSEEEAGESYLATVDDDDLAQRIYEAFMERLFDDEDEES